MCSRKMRKKTSSKASPSPTLRPRRRASAVVSATNTLRATHQSAAVAVRPAAAAAGEVAGFGGGGYHGYNALEGTFLGGCIFSGKVVGEAL